MGLLTTILSTLYVLASPVWMIPQIFFFSIYNLPLKIIKSVLGFFGIRYDIQLLMEFFIVVYQYIMISFIVGACFGMLNLFLFWIVRFSINWLDQLFRYDTASLFQWISTDKTSINKNSEGFENLPRRTTTNLSTESTESIEPTDSAKSTNQTESTINKENPQSIILESSKPNVTLTESTPFESATSLDTETEAELLLSSGKTSTTQTSHHTDGSIIQRNGVRRPKSPTEDNSTITTNSVLDEDISQTVDTSFQEEEEKQ